MIQACVLGMNRELIRRVVIRLKIHRSNKALGKTEVNYSIGSEERSAIATGSSLQAILTH